MRWIKHIIGVCAGKLAVNSIFVDCYEKILNCICTYCSFLGRMCSVLHSHRLNRISRFEVIYLDGNYNVVYSPVSGKERVYKVTNDKVTTESGKGYYFFWADKETGDGKRYVQVPIMFSVVEEQ